MRPRIGLTCSFGRASDPPQRERNVLNAAYADAVYAAGGLPLALPVPASFDETPLGDLLRSCDGVVFTGGCDLDPRRLGEPLHPRTRVMHPRRERFEVELFRVADRLRIPLLAICLGHQVAHLARGGRLIQHIDNTDEVQHHAPHDGDAFHEVHIEPDSRLAQIMGCTRCRVNSRHHQVVDPQRPGRGLRSVAFSPDGRLEASEDLDGRFLITVQWHPESTADESAHAALFTALAEQAARRRADSCR